MSDILKKTGVRDAVGELNVGNDVYEAAEAQVRALLEDAAERAEANGRKTVKARDL